MTSERPIVSASILAADPGKYAAEISSAVNAGTDWIHIDVMDGSFVPPITFGDNIVAAARKTTDIFLDTHLMIVRPEEHILKFKEAGTDSLTIHQEVSPNLHRSLAAIKKSGISCGASINPGTPISTIFDVLELCDLVLVMTVNPGWGGQKFIPECLSKICGLREEIERRNLKTKIQVDGGVNEKIGKECVKAGAHILVAGSYIFSSPDRKKAVASLRG